MYRSIGLRALAGACVLVLFGLLSGCGNGSSSSDWFYHWNCNGDPECLATNPGSTPSGTADEGNQTSCDQLLTFGNQFWGIPPATQSCDQDPNGSSGGGNTVTISGFTPASTAPGNNVTITGSGFPTSGLTVTLNGVACAVVSATSTQIVITVPAMGNFTGPLVVSGVSSTGSFSVLNHFYGIVATIYRTYAVGGNSSFAASGALWTNPLSLGSSNYLSAAAEGLISSNPVFVTVGQNGAIYNMIGAGLAWTAQSSGTTQNLFGAAWSGTQFLAVGAGGTILTSPDGATWTARTSGTGQTLGAAAWCGSQFVVTGSNGTILTSPDGITWTPRSSGTTNLIAAVGCSGSLIVAGEGSDSATGGIATSPDGITWTQRPLSGTNAIYGVAWSGAQFAAVGLGGTIYTSPDGVTWTARNSGTTNSLNAVGWSQQIVAFFAVGGFGTIRGSTDGINWTTINP